MHLVSPRCAALSESLSPLGRRALAAFIDGRLPAGQLQDELLRASNLESPTPVHQPAQAPGRTGTRASRWPER